MKYFNVRSKQYGVETIDEIDPKDYATSKEFREELNRLVKEARMSGNDVYISQKCTKEWKNR